MQWAEWLVKQYAEKGGSDLIKVAVEAKRAKDKWFRKHRISITLLGK